MLLELIFFVFISFLLSCLTSDDKLMGFDGSYRRIICINCFMHNHFCSMWSSADWFSAFKQACNTAGTWREHWTYVWVVPLSSLWWCLRTGRQLPIHTCPALGLSVQPGHRWEICIRKKQICKSCRHSPMAESRMTCTASPLCRLPRMCLHHHHHHGCRHNSWLDWLLLPQHLAVSHLPDKSTLLWGQAGLQPRCRNSVWYMLLLRKFTFQ